MKKILLLVLVITLFFSCEDKSKLSYVVAEKILLDENDPYRFKHVRDVIMNASRDEYNKHYIDIETKKETVLYHDWEYPALSPFYLPNGEDIAFNRNLQLQVLRKGESIPEPLIGTRSAKDEITLGGVLSVGSYENGCTSNGTWSYDDEYIMYDTSDGHGNQAYAVTPLFKDPQKITTVIFLGLGGKAAWCPLPPGE